MFGKLHLLLAVACVAVLFGEAFCASSTANWGNLAGTKYDLAPIYLDGPVRDWTVNIPPYNCKENGGISKVTDDVAPDVYYQDPHTLKVHRNGNLQTPALVEAHVFCLN